ncbi:hypothetical protein AC1031_021106 [Aphanomyces cochlioides]|nr:hypothetical protein AC1031_021106 [Aphanomyces cochlioides]
MTSNTSIYAVCPSPSIELIKKQRRHDECQDEKDGRVDRRKQSQTRIPQRIECNQDYKTIPNCLSKTEKPEAERLKVVGLADPKMSKAKKFAVCPELRQQERL